MSICKNSGERYRVRVNDGELASAASLVEVWAIIDDQWARIGQNYKLTFLHLWVQDFGEPSQTVPVRVFSDNIARRVWIACCPTPGAFEKWLRVCRWM